ncbi:hypothetical protein LCGC14_2894590, partial [marine sediment metagenome]
MGKQLNTILLVVGVLLLAYIAFLKPNHPRFANTVRSRLLVEIATG